MEKATEEAAEKHPHLESYTSHRVAHAEAVTPVSTELTFPHLLQMVPDEHTRKELERRLKTETENIKWQFFILINKFFDSLEESNIPIPTLMRYLAFPLEMSILSPERTTMTDVYEIIKSNSSFFNYKLVEYMIELAGSPSDKERLAKYIAAFIEYAKRRIYECPSTIRSNPTSSGAELHVKLDSRYDNCTVNELQDFQDRLCEILNKRVYVFLLLSVERGCLKLIFMIPKHLLESIYPLSPEQKTALIECGVAQLTGNIQYQFLQQVH